MSEHKNKYIDKAFAKHLPSAFIVGSPFQLLCAIEAIHEFEIEDTKFVFSIVRNSSRNVQIFTIAKQYGIEEYYIYYEQEYEDEYINTKEKNILKHREKGCYERIFIGDPYNKYYYLLALSYAAKDAIYVGLDDGNSSILFLQHIDKIRKPQNWRKRLNWYRSNYLKQREQVLTQLKDESVYDSGCMFTVYNEVKSQYSIYPNTLSHVAVRNSELNKEDVIIIIGTVLDVYAWDIGITETLMESVTWYCISRVREKYPSYKIIFIPHGRDINEHIAQFCQMLGIIYQRIDEVVEIYLLNSIMNPVAIYGFDSSALVHLKKLYPLSEVHTWRLRHCNKDNDQITEAIGEYYTKIGIIEDTIWVHKKNFANISTFIENMRSMFWLLYDKLFGTKHN